MELAFNFVKELLNGRLETANECNDNITKRRRPYDPLCYFSEYFERKLLTSFNDYKLKLPELNSEAATLNSIVDAKARQRNRIQVNGGINDNLPLNFS